MGQVIRNTARDFLAAVPTTAFFREETLSKIAQLTAPSLTVFSAGAGYGKTTLMRQVQQGNIASGTQTLWIDCQDETDLPDLSQLVRRGLHFFVDHYESRTNPNLDSFLENIVRQNSDLVRIFIASRKKLGLVETARIHGFATLEFGHSDLAYQDGNLASILPKGARLDGQLRKIQMRAEGWPLIQQILLRDGGQAKCTIDTYLGDTLLGALNQCELRFATLLSYCRVFNIDLAQRLTQVTDPTTLIEALRQKGIPIYSPRLNDGSQWYRIHPLIAKSLQQHGDELNFSARDIHYSAADWFVENGFLFDALRHLCLAGDVARIKDAIENAPIVVRSVSHIGLMRKLIGEFSRIGLGDDPKSLTLSAWLLVFLGEYDAVFEIIAQLRNQQKPQNQDLAIQQSIILASTLVSLDRFEEAQSELEKVDRSQISNPFVMQSYVSAMIGIELGLNKFSAVIARSLVEQVCRDETLNDEVSLIIRGQILSGHLRHGHIKDVVHMGRALCAKAVSAHGHGSVTVHISSIFIAAAEYQLGNLDMARTIIEARLRALRRGAAQQVISGLTVYAAILRNEEGPEAAEAFLRKQSGWVEARDIPRCTAYLKAHQLRYLLELGEFQSARELSAQIDELVAKQEFENGYGRDILILSHLTHARVSNADSCFQTASLAADQAASLGRKSELHDLLAEALILGAIAKIELASPEAADQLCAAVEICKGHALARVLLDSGFDWGAHLHDLETAMSADTWVWLTRDVLKISYTDEHHNVECYPSVALTPREAEIVDLLGEFQTNKEIARTLGLSPETIKWNMKNIFQKYDATDRRDVVKMSRQLG